MVEFVNKLTGTAMWVAEDRVDEYLAAGHKLAAGFANADKPTEDKPKKKTTTKKKTTSKAKK